VESGEKEKTTTEWDHMERYQAAHRKKEEKTEKKDTFGVEKKGYTRLTWPGGRGGKKEGVLVWGGKQGLQKPIKRKYPHGGGGGGGGRTKKGAPKKKQPSPKRKDGQAKTRKEARQPRDKKRWSNITSGRDTAMGAVVSGKNRRGGGGLGEFGMKKTNKKKKKNDHTPKKKKKTTDLNLLVALGNGRLHRDLKCTRGEKTRKGGVGKQHYNTREKIGKKKQLKGYGHSSRLEKWVNKTENRSREKRKTGTEKKKKKGSPKKRAGRNRDQTGKTESFTGRSADRGAVKQGKFQG